MDITMRSNQIKNHITSKLSLNKLKSYANAQLT